MIIENRRISRELQELYQRLNAQCPLPGRTVQPAPNIKIVPGRIEAGVLAAQAGRQS